MLLNVAAPSVVVITILFMGMTTYRRAHKRDYVNGMLSRQVNQLLKHSLSTWLEAMNEANQHVKETHTQRPFHEVKEVAWQQHSDSIWGWESWHGSDSFRKAYKRPLFAYKFAAVLGIALLMLVPLVFGWIRVSDDSDWGAGMTSICDPARVALIVAPIPLLVAGIVSVKVMRLINRV